MMLTKKQTEQFVEFYKGLYGDTSKELPEINIKDFPGHLKQWKHCVQKMLGKQYDKTYKIRPYGPESYGHKIFNSLFLQYFPKVLEDDGTPADFKQIDKIWKEVFNI